MEHRRIILLHVLRGLVIFEDCDGVREWANDDLGDADCVYVIRGGGKEDVTEYHGYLFSSRIATMRAKEYDLARQARDLLDSGSSMESVQSTIRELRHDSIAS